LLAHEEIALQIDVAGLVPGLFIRVQNIAEEGICAGVVHEDVETFAAAFNLGEEPSDLLHFARMACQGLRCAPRLNDLLLRELADVYYT
jgi:hypothetical protein